MRRLTSLCVLLALPLSASANGFGIFHRPLPPPVVYYVPVPVERSTYYLPGSPLVFAPPLEGVPHAPVPAVEPAFPAAPVFPVAPTFPTQPVLPPSGPVLPPLPRPGVPQAPVEVAPPSNDPLIPPIRPMPPVDRSTSARPVLTPFDLYSGDTAQASAPGRFVVRFWNLSAESLQLTIDGQPLTLPRGQSRTVEVGEEFTWQISGRAVEVSRVPANARGATVAIRR